MKHSKPLALGIHWAHDASVALCSPDGIIAAVQEERVTRIKHYYGFPCTAIEAVLAQAQVKASDISAVAFSTQSVLYPEYTNYYSIAVDGTVTAGATEQAAGRWQSWDRAAVQRDVSAAWGEFAPRHYAFQYDYLRACGLLHDAVTVYYIAHHRAHAAAAFRLAGQAPACVITVDGKGDGVAATIYRATAEGQLQLLRATPAEQSVGSFYQAVTEVLGFIPVDGEYKTMGLAALYTPPPTEENPFAHIISVRDGIFHSTYAWTFRDYNEHHPESRVNNPLRSVTETEKFKKYLSSYSREGIAYYAQAVCEQSLCAYVRDAMNVTGCRDIVAAGGVLLNVKANMRVCQEVRPDSFFVFPDAADSGLAVGAAMEALAHAGAPRRKLRFADPFVGLSFDNAQVRAAIEKYTQKYSLVVEPATPAGIAQKLAAGMVIGVFRGRMECGPRALGNRSVLADPRRQHVKDKINLILKGREWFVPFAPAVLAEDAHLYWNGSTELRFMTVAVTASDYARRTVPAVVHTDGTMRPEVVSANFNPDFYALLQAFKKITDVGVLLNTSFNRHGLPIVGSPEDALQHLVHGWVEGVYVGDWYVSPNKGVS